MNLRLMIGGIILTSLSLQSCNDKSDDDLHQSQVPTAVLNTFEKNNPQAKAQWELSNGMYHAEFWQQGLQNDAWYKPNGTWVRTETDYQGALPAKIQEYINANYANYRVDDVDIVTTPQGNFYEVELDREGAEDVTIRMTVDGMPQSEVPAKVLSAFEQSNPRALAQWEIENGLYHVESWQQGVEHDSWYTADGTWIRTERDYHGTLPANVQAYINTNYRGYMVDDVDYITTPQGNYYEVELEKDNAPDVKVRVTEEGKSYNQTPTTGNQQNLLTNAKWDAVSGLYKVEGAEQGVEYDSWYTADGTWVRTEKDYQGVIPIKIQTYINTNYVAYHVEDIDIVTTPQGNYYKVELEKLNAPDVTLRITEDGVSVV